MEDGNIVNAVFSRSVEGNGSWVKRQVSSSITIPQDLPLSARLISYTQLGLEQSLVVLNQLYMLDGAISVEQYNDAVKALEANVEQFKNGLLDTGYIIIPVHNGVIEQPIICDNVVVAMQLSRNKFGCELDNLVNSVNLPSEYSGSRCFKQQHCKSVMQVMEFCEQGT